MSAQADTRFIPYEIPVRPDGVCARLLLPVDLTAEEAGRLCEVIRSLAFPAGPRPIEIIPLEPASRGMGGP